MNRRVINHILFWTVFVLTYAIIKFLFAGPTDLKYDPWIRLVRFTFVELFFLPWKIIPFYTFYYYILPQYLKEKKFITGTLIFIGIIIICILGFRSGIAPISQILYKEEISFNSFSLKRMLYTISELIPAFGLASAIKLFKDFLRADLRAQKMEIEKSSMELKYLRAHSNPHFLFNTLNNLYGLSRKNHPQTSDYILKLSSVIRYVNEYTERSEVSLEKELNIIREFIELEKLRLGNRVKVESIWPENDVNRYIIPPLILSSLTENAFKHVSAQVRHEGFIKIVVNTEKEWVYFQIINTVESQEEISTGFGLKSVERQLQLIYKNQFEMKYQIQNDEFQMNLKIKSLKDVNH